MPNNINQETLDVLASPSVASKRWAYRRYDHMVQTGSVIRPGEGDAAVLRIRAEDDGEDRFIAVASDGNHRFVARNPRLGGQLAVCESARNVVCVGGEPLGVTNCLNFGSPERPEIFGQFTNAVKGLGEACIALGIPVTGGNVSFYNEVQGNAIPPTPMIGLVGLVEDESHITNMAWKSEGDVIVVLGPRPEGQAGSEFAKIHLGADQPGEAALGQIMDFNLDTEIRLQRTALTAIRKGLIESAHDVSDGGIAVTIAESCLAGLGAEIDALPGESLAVSLFGELPPRIVVSVKPENLDALLGIAGDDTEVAVIGKVTTGGLSLLDSDAIAIEELRTAHSTLPFDGANR